MRSLIDMITEEEIEQYTRMVNRLPEQKVLERIAAKTVKELAISRETKVLQQLYADILEIMWCAADKTTDILMLRTVLASITEAIKVAARQNPEVAALVLSVIEDE